MLLERKKIAIVLAEFLGTALLTAVFLAVSRSNLSYIYFVALAAGLTLTVGNLVFAPISGAHFNPIVTLGLWTARKVPTLQSIVYIVAQLFGGMVAYMLYTYLVDNTITGHTEYNSKVLVAEAVGAFVFSLGWAATVYNKMESAKAAFVIGASFTVGMLAASVASAGILNPAVALGLQNWGWGTYVLGPVLGGVIGFNLYALLFAPSGSLVASSKNDKK
jgi:aquaporin Z